MNGVSPAVPAPSQSLRLAQARETAQKFEAVLIGQMAKIMLESAGDPGDFGGGHGEAMFRGVLAEHLGTQMARAGGIGLAPAVLDQILRLQGGSADAAREALVGKDKVP